MPGPYYVRITGNNGNLGTSPAQAWRNVDYAANQVAAGDIVYIGSGFYPELVTMDTPGAAGNLIQFIGDITGVYTGDPGPVIISAHDTQTAAAARTYSLDMGTRDFVTWSNVIFLGGSTAAVGNATASNIAYEGCAFYDCAFIASEQAADYALYLDVNTGVTPATLGLQCVRCVFMGTIVVLHNTNAVAHLPIKWDFLNCVIIGHSATANVGVYFDGTGADAYTIGDIDVMHCIIMGCNYGMHGDILKDTTNQLRLTYSTIYGCAYAAYETGSTNNAVYENYNHVVGCTDIIAADVQQGGNSDKTLAGMVLGGIADLMFYKTFGWSPWKPWEPMALQDASFLEAQIGAAAGSAATDDIYGNPRPMRRSALNDIGPVEARTRPQAEITTVYPPSTTGIKMAGAGYHDMLVPVNAIATVITVGARMDANYTGTKPKLEVYNIPGDTDKVDTMTAAVNTWEDLTVTVTPTSAGFCRVRLRSLDTSATGITYFGVLTVR